MKFKRGAFSAMRTVLPTVFKMSKRSVMPTFDVIDFWPFMMLYYASPIFHVSTLYMLPEFTPTHWMLEKHSDKGSADWEIYAECVREAMAKYGNL